MVENLNFKSQRVYVELEFLISLSIFRRSLSQLAIAFMGLDRIELLSCLVISVSSTETYPLYLSNSLSRNSLFSLKNCFY